MFKEVNQGSIGDCFLIASLSAIADYPELIKQAFITPKKNSAHIHGIKLYIRGKPWVISIDDKLVML